MKKEIKINFLRQGGQFDKENNFFTNLLGKRYNVVLSDKPDYVFFSAYTFPESFNFKEQNPQKKSLFKKIFFPILKRYIMKYFVWFLVSKKIIGKTKIPEVKGNFVKIFYTFENVVPDMNKCDWAFSFCYEDEFKHPKHMRLPYYFVAAKGNSLIKDVKKMNPKKDKFCNFIYRNHIPFRIKFFKKLQKYKGVDAPGECMRNMEYIDNRDKMNWLELQRKYLKPYKFSIAFENSSSSGYTTEKLIQPMLAGSIPIYWGNPEVGRDFNKKSFLDLQDFKSMEDLIKRIIEIDNDNEEYKKILKEPWLKNNKPNKWMDKKKILERLIKIIESKK